MTYVFQHSWKHTNEHKYISFSKGILSMTFVSQMLQVAECVALLCLNDQVCVPCHSKVRLFM